MAEDKTGVQLNQGHTSTDDFLTRKYVLPLLQDEETKGILMIGEIGGTAEEDAAEFILDSSINKPMSAFIAGVSAPRGKRMGHAGAIISGNKGTAESKIEALRKANIAVAPSPAKMGETMLVEMQKRYN